MDHDQAANRITDWVAGRLPDDEAAGVGTHVRECEDCREVAAAARGVREAVLTHGEHLFTAHVASDSVARYALAAQTLSHDELESIGGHLSACPACAADLALVRAAATPAPLRELRAWRPAGLWSAALRPALAVLALLLVVPAYLGVVELPRERARNHTLEQRLATPAPRPAVALVPAPSNGWSGGAVDVLILTGPTRGAAGPLPTARLRPGQSFQPVFVDAPLPKVDSLVVRLRDADGALVWRLVAPRAGLWDAPQRFASLLIPTQRLTPGEYRLEIAPPGAGSPAYSARFRITAPTDR